MKTGLSKIAAAAWLHAGARLADQRTSDVWEGRQAVGRWALRRDRLKAAVEAGGASMHVPFRDPSTTTEDRGWGTPGRHRRSPAGSPLPPPLLCPLCGWRPGGKHHCCWAGSCRGPGGGGSGMRQRCVRVRWHVVVGCACCEAVWQSTPPQPHTSPRPQPTPRPHLAGCTARTAHPEGSHSPELSWEKARVSCSRTAVVPAVVVGVASKEGW